MAQDIFILGGKRTPMCQYVGALKDVKAIDLGAAAARGALEASGVAADEIDHTVVGNALQTSGDAIYGARHVALKAGVPHDRPALTVNRLCGSGIQSVVSGAHMILLGEARTALVGGMESMSMAPHVIYGARSGFALGQGKLEDSLMVALLDTYCNTTMAGTAENLARRYEISREEQDAYALRSQAEAARAQAAGVFAEEIVAVEVKTRKGVKVVDKDDHLRPDTTLEVLAKLPTAFSKDGFVTAGNASGIVDGAAALVIAGGDYVRERGAKPLGRVVSWAYAGVEPDVMGIGPVPAVRKALEKANLKLEEIDVVEVNEAFACQYLAVEKELGLDRSKTNVNGGAIALGHPLGASGTRLVLTALNELHRREGRYGLASACIGGGQGIAIIFERV
ncbi:MAG TPA: acetyl-CoA C-acyltransferase [Pyrinomonadaceae bacterium]|nr:acetyl-CoA C-acyltransferase [Pyrinomonadaceae bacterium]HWS86261.1 acetyl-CoA C-acyltransferase [Pyrinomonadaceae bacterium]